MTPGTALANAGVKDIQLRDPQVGVMGIIERLASDPNFDTAKLEKLIELNERALARDSKQAFHAALSAAQAEMRPVQADANNPQTRSRYASYAAIDNKLRPIYTTHGFGLSFNTAESPIADHIRILCNVSHAGGHCETYQVDMPADGKGAKGGDVMTKTHATGAAMSYGMRYLLKMIFNVAVGEDDRDGNEAQAIADPDGFMEWWDSIDKAAEKGMAAFREAWDKSSEAFRRHTVTHYRQQHEARKRRAAGVRQ